MGPLCLVLLCAAERISEAVWRPRIAPPTHPPAGGAAPARQDRWTRPRRRRSFPNPRGAEAAGCARSHASPSGYRRVHAVLQRMNVQAGAELVRALMRELGLVPCQPRPWRATTIADDAAK
ncbi:IS3 family transposase [Streptomyces sp. RLB1-33]